ncbi:microvitellogenin-like [Manduca sexta]|uniref:microvitellogenin-like n=1 Tax=Manduca sexta TaxID=7130 RepID=UPI00188DEABD|nr:microvitellogenin-like [Manduca sexta]XP_037297485.1 microvitellogenin-like [Manduca sexta]
MLRLTLLLTLAALACHAAPRSDDEAVEHLYRSVIISDYETALSQSKELEKARRGNVISKLVDKLIAQKPHKSMYYAYYLWNHNAQDIVKNSFPIQFKMIFGQHTTKIINKKFGMELKIGLSTDSYGERNVYGVSTDNDIGKRASWEFTSPEAADHKVYFKIYNPHDNQYMKTTIFYDTYKDHLINTSTNSDTFRHQWYLQPVVVNKELLFYIINREYDELLKLSQSPDSDGDREAFTHGEDASGDPERFGWKIERY